MTSKTKKNLLKNSGTNFVSLSGIIPSLSATTSGTKYLREDLEWVTLNNKKDRIFRFKVNGQEILHTIFEREYVKRVEYCGTWPFKYTRIYLVDNLGQDRSTISNIDFRHTTQEEHNEIKEQIYDWLYREKLIEAL